ncbi:hypothetical protein [Paenibacillus algorifonticola]|uniref:hypothetical protein n=1 Tax=Paenibacillus algorifonticola TaxID=684063 RepID=UPI000945A8A8|nr:hypothetical protein [Paenibacillus algorifonticola]
MKNEKTARGDTKKKEAPHSKKETPTDRANGTTEYYPVSAKNNKRTRIKPNKGTTKPQKPSPQHRKKKKAKEDPEEIKKKRKTNANEYYAKIKKESDNDTTIIHVGNPIGNKTTGINKKTA